MATPQERSFPVFTSGQVRDEIILRRWRNSLRQIINPDTGTLFTEDEIARATQPGSRFYMQADAHDSHAMVQQSRGLYMVDQQRPKRSSTAWLNFFHGPLWLGDDSRLAATGGSGIVRAPASLGSVFVGSTTVPDPAASVATDPNGYRYQVLVTHAVDASDVSAGGAILQMQGVDKGVNTNPPTGTKLRWSANQPLGADPECTVLDDPATGVAGFSGGFDEETDAEYGERIEAVIRHRPACGNNAHFWAWALESTNAIGAAFVYATVLNAGSVMVVVLQKRNPAADPPEGPLIRVNPSIGTMVAANSYLVPPNSPVLAERAFVVVTSPNPQPSNLVLRVSMALGTGGGWADDEPWPNPPVQSAFPSVEVSNVTSPTVFDVLTDSDLPGGAISLSGDDAPQLMVWNNAISRFEALDVAQVSKVGSVATITLNTAPSHVIALDDRISPFTDRQSIISGATEDYFDELGPGEMVDLTLDPRGARAFRWPTPAERSPIRAGELLSSRLVDALGGASPDVALEIISRNEPDLPGNIIDGPYQVVLGDVAVYPL